MKSTVLLLAAAVFLFCVAPIVRADSPPPSMSEDDIQYVNDNLDILYDSGIFEGYPDGEFAGENLVTRYEAGVTLTRFYTHLLDNIEERGIHVMDFVDIRHPLDTPMDMTDIPESHWAYEEIQRLERMGVAGGYPDWRYMGSNEVTRYEFVAMVLRVVVLVDFGLWEASPGYNGGFQSTHLAKPELIGDAPVDYWARADVRRIIDAGALTSDSEDDETDNAQVVPFTRYELAFTLMNLIGKFNSELDNL